MASDDNDWTVVFASWHDKAVAQGKKVDEILAVCKRDEPPSVLRNALNEVAAEVLLQRWVLNAVRMGIARGHLTGAEDM